MIINVNFKQIDPSDAIRDYATEKAEKLKKYFDGKTHVTWTFSIEHQDKIAHCHLVGQHMDLFGEANAESLYAAIDLSIDKVEKQVRRHKEQVTNHK